MILRRTLNNVNIVLIDNIMTPFDLDQKGNYLFLL